MRNSILIVLTLFTVEAFSQKVLISGTALDSTKGRNQVYIVVNDTLRKFREGKSPNWDDYRNLIKDTTLSLYTKPDGKFQLNVNKTDSIFFQSFKHITEVYCVSDLLKMKNINIRLEPQICIPYVHCNDTLPSKFYIFIGQKLNVITEQEPYYCDIIPMDSKVKAEYKILEQVVGKFPKDTIMFVSFNHNQRITFSNYENVLLFVSEYCGQLYHEKYQYFDLYKTVDGKWASPGDPYKYDEYHRKNIKSQNIQFADSVWFDISKLSEAVIKRQFPIPFYKIDGQKAIPIMGCYIDELVLVKKGGVLKARKITFD
ncbi:MAG: hypothetical protein WKF35_13695 [Ferruginibacter sp.]